jgi:hypothetical protein
MRTIFSNRFIEINYDPDQKQIYVRWTEECENIATDGYKEEFEKINAEIENLVFEKAMVDFHNCQYFIQPDNQREYHENIFSKLSFPSGTWVALIVPENLLFYARHEANRANLVNTGTQIQFFKEKGKAEKWLETK